MVKVNVEKLVENHLGETKLKFTLIGHVGSPPLIGRGIMMYLAKCYKLIFMY